MKANFGKGSFLDNKILYRKTQGPPNGPSPTTTTTTTTTVAAAAAAASAGAASISPRVSHTRQLNSVWGPRAGIIGL